MQIQETKIVPLLFSVRKQQRMQVLNIEDFSVEARYISIKYVEPKSLHERQHVPINRREQDPVFIDTPITGDDL